MFAMFLPCFIALQCWVISSVVFIMSSQHLCHTTRSQGRLWLGRPSRHEGEARQTRPGGVERPRGPPGADGAPRPAREQGREGRQRWARVRELCRKCACLSKSPAMLQLSKHTCSSEFLAWQVLVENIFLLKKALCIFLSGHQGLDGRDGLPGEPGMSNDILMWRYSIIMFILVMNCFRLSNSLETVYKYSLIYHRCLFCFWGIPRPREATFAIIVQSTI